MTGIEHAQHDVDDARSSVESALDVLISLERDGGMDSKGLRTIIDSLRQASQGLEDAAVRLAKVEEPVV